MQTESHKQAELCVGSAYIMQKYVTESQINDSQQTSVLSFNNSLNALSTLLIKKRNGLTGYCFCIQVDPFGFCEMRRNILTDVFSHLCLCDDQTCDSFITF